MTEAMEHVEPEVKRGPGRPRKETFAESVPPVEAPKLQPGHVWMRVLAKGHGKIFTGANLSLPKIDGDDPRVHRDIARQMQEYRDSDRPIPPSESKAFLQLKAEMRDKALATVFAMESVDTGLCYGKGDLVQVPKASSFALEEKGFAERDGG